ncbi:succinyl-CoA synthetase subunit alpha [Candidatus Micrarchaeota archaeon]|nr:MAG: succinyl-CoA synthetase subunit alpha [Candidatus Micrarchaeota archaeon]
MDNYRAYLNADLSQYAGMWVIIANGSIVKAGQDVKKMVESIKKKHPNIKLFIAKVPSQNPHML